MSRTARDIPGRSKNMFALHSPDYCWNFISQREHKVLPRGKLTILKMYLIYLPNFNLGCLASSSSACSIVNIEIDEVKQLKPLSFDSKLKRE